MSPSRVGAQAPPTGTHSTTAPDAPTTCGTCQSYLQNNRNRLLPHLGNHVVRTGRPPARLVAKLLRRYHQLGHPGVVQYVISAADAKAANTDALNILNNATTASEATKALQRLAKTRRPA